VLGESLDHAEVERRAPYAAAGQGQPACLEPVSGAEEPAERARMIIGGRGVSRRRILRSASRVARGGSRARIAEDAPATLLEIADFLLDHFGRERRKRVGRRCRLFHER